MGSIISLITPLLLHMAVTELASVFLAGRLDTAAGTAVASLLVLPAAVWMYQRDRKAERSEKFSAGTALKRGGKGKLLLSVLCLSGGAALNLLWSSLLYALRIQEHFSNQAQEAMLGSGLFWQVVGLILLVPVTEELIFRGLIYTRMKRFFPVKISVFLSALLFAVYHGNPIQMIFAFPMALALAAVYERGGSLLYPVLFHVGANAAAVLAAL